MNLPNTLTVARLGLAFVFVGLVSFQNAAAYIVAYAVFTAAALTDYYDGRIARARGLITNFGKLLDPVADKVLLVSAFIMMMQMTALWVPGWTVVVILTREFLVTGARALAASEGAVIAASHSGKMKTVFQMVYVFVFLFVAIAFELVRGNAAVDAFLPGGLERWMDVASWASMVGIVGVAGLTIYSGVRFARDNWKILGLGDGV